MKYELPELPYAYSALEPYIDAKTMETHHGQHHRTYTDRLNAVLAKYPKLAEIPIEKLIADLPNLQMEEEDRTALKNHGGGYINHAFFWTVMGPKKEIDAQLVEDAKNTFGSVEECKQAFGEAATKQFGSGWAWLVRDETGMLTIYSLPNQDSPLTLGHTPLITIDVWEHAYYLKYRDRRAEYIENWWNVLKLL